MIFGNNFPLTVPSGGIPSTSFASSPSTIPFGGMPSMTFGNNSPSTVPYGGMSSSSYGNSPSNLPFGGIPSIPVANSPSLNSFTTNPSIGAYAYPNQNLQMTQGLGGLQTYLPPTATSGFAQTGYPQMITSPQQGFNSAANPLSNIGATGVQYQSYSNQLSNSRQVGSTGFNPSYDYLKGFKDGFEPSHFGVNSAQSFAGSSQNHGVSSQLQTISMTNTNSICDYARQNCPPSYPSQIQQYPFTQQSSIGMIGNSEAVLQHGVDPIPRNTEVLQSSPGVLGGPEMPSQSGVYNTPQDIQASVGADQSPMSFQQETPQAQTSAGPTPSYTSDQNLMNQSARTIENSQSSTSSDAAHPTTGFQETTMAMQNDPKLEHGTVSEFPRS
ncbi:hypothetical protein RF11_07047 [Thelohanellus kitauei]|uniref:Uncharacterized protein n=1 Tax=Thelohanellus kitauei TaxID=669202 RepID=A0A0C2MT30_THEKT|nr:hypothetical protein RF11_07047 [Thelohanellus kitauei]